MTIIPFTKNGYEDLKKQLEGKISERPAAVKELTRGRDMGDLSENGLYKAAKQNLVDIDRQIRHLKNLVKYGKPNIPANNDYIQLGHHVVVETFDGKKEYEIVGEFEANTKEQLKAKVCSLSVNTRSVFPVFSKHITPTNSPPIRNGISIKEIISLSFEYESLNSEVKELL